MPRSNTRSFRLPAARTHPSESSQSESEKVRYSTLTDALSRYGLTTKSGSAAKPAKGAHIPAIRTDAPKAKRVHHLRVSPTSHKTKLRVFISSKIIDSRWR